MSSAGTPSVGVRFFLAGGQEVKRGFDEIRDSGRRMWQEIANGSRSAAPGVRALNQAAVETKDVMAAVAANSGGVGRILAVLGPAGILAAVGIGAMVAAFREAAKVMEEGEQTFNMAARLKVSTDALQEYRYAIEQVGGTAQDADSALSAFTEKFGGARGGFKRDLLPFQELGFKKEDLQKFQTADQLLSAVADKIANLSSDAEQADIADRLGIGALLPLLRQGGDAIDQMRAKAHEGGGVIESDLIVRARNAQEHFQQLSRTVGSDLTRAFSLVIPAVEKLMRWVQKLGDWIAKLPGIRAAGGWRNTDDDLKSLDDLKAQRDEVQKLLEAARNAKVSDFAPAVDISTGEQEDHATYVKRTTAMIADQQAQLQKRRDQIDLAITKREQELAQAGGYDPNAKHGTGKLTNPQEKEDADNLADQQNKRFLSLMAAAQQKRLQAEDDDTKSVVERKQIGLQRLAAEESARHAELDQAVKAKELTDAQAAEVRAAEDSARKAEAAALLRKAQVEIMQQSAAYESSLAGFGLELLRLQEQMAVTVRDRHALQLQIYDAEREQARKELAQKNDLNPNLTPDQRQSELDQFDKVTAVGRAQINQQFDGLQQTIHDATRDGFLAGLQDGPKAALKAFFGDLAKHFADKAADNFADRMQDVLDDIGSFILKSLDGGGAGGGGFFPQVGSVLASALGFGGGHASGGGLQSGYRYKVAEHDTELAVFGRSGQVFDPISTMKLFRDAMGNDGGVTVHTTFAPVYNVTGNSEDIAALRQQMAKDQASFRSNVIATINDAHARGMINPKRK